MRRVLLRMGSLGMVVLLFSGVLAALVQADTPPQQAFKKLLSEATTQRELLALGLASQEMGKATSAQVLKALADHQAAQRMAERAARAITPEIRLQAIRTAILLSRARGIDFVQELKKSRGETSAAVLSAYLEEGIRGTVTVAGRTPERPIAVVAFDSLGYVVQVGETDRSGQYELMTGPGKFYVMTVSNDYVDELYDNVPAPFGDKRGWRAATPIVVPRGAQVAGINFDLDDGAVISGTVLDPDGFPFTDVVTFKLTSASNPTVLLTYEGVTDPSTGAYVLHVPAPGDYKLSAEAQGYGPIWYRDKTDWTQADVIHIGSTADEIRGVDFTLRPISPATAGGAISGQIMGPTFVNPVFLAFAVAFNAADTSVAGIGLSLLGSPYVISGLPPGRYYVWANDLLGDLMRGLLPTAANYQGEFYDNAKTPSQATLVSVVENDTTAGINFMLDKGATIQGTVKGPDWKGLDSVLVVAVDRQIATAVNDPFLSHLQIEVSITDENGSYMLTGLRQGEWVLRTLTVLKHGGEVLDEYYQNHHSLWDFEQANVIQAGEGATISGVDFTLEAPAFVTGLVTDAVGGDPVVDALLVAIELNRGLPEFAFGNSGEDGSYSLGPLPPGDYAILCLIPDKTHLSEFYDGAYDLAHATPVHIPGSGVHSGINFTLERGATVAGFVRFPNGVPVGADSLYRFPVVAYEANTGKLADFAFVQFPGGYRIHNLMPGSYKIAAVPILYGYATTYVGGGDSFGDPASTVLDLGANELRQANITLAVASGSISGKVRDATTGKPLTQAMVLAYDVTGHLEGLGVTGVDLSSLTPTASPDVYKIQGLRPGTYYLRTFALTSAIPLGAGLDLTSLGLPNLEGGIPDLSGLMNLGGMFELPELHLDVWHHGVYATDLDLSQLSLLDLVLALMRHGSAHEKDADVIPFFLPLPFAVEIPSAATPVNVGTGETQVDFELPSLNLREALAVEQKGNRDPELPRDFALRPAYPNPFNPRTQIEWELPAASPVRVEIYNLLGVKVKELVREVQPAGVHSAVWDATDERGQAAPSGVYLIRMEAGNFRATRKVILMK